MGARDSLIHAEFFENLSPGSVTAIVNDDQANMNWTNDLSSQADALAVIIHSGATALNDNIKPSVFNDLSDGSWTATVSYQKKNSDPVSASTEFTIQVVQIVAAGTP